ncbi:MAG: GNAT family N-acetyltransferase [Chloroflexi bacterium]|nr:GNAT family N-acetyltransferase [Chloroflexota bacterium]
MKTPYPSGTRSPDNNVIVGAKVRLRAKRLSDAENDYAWQVDPELSRLDAAPPLDMPFSQYLSVYASELWYSNSKTRQRYAVDTTDGTHIGNCGYYNIDPVRGEAELGIMIGNRDYWDKGYGVDIIAALLKDVFTKKKFKRIHLKTLKSNTRAQKCFEKCGFAPYGQATQDNYRFVFMQTDRSQWEKLQGNTVG